MTERLTVVAYIPDLMDRSRLANVRADVTFVKTPEELRAALDADIAVADLGRPGSLEALSSLVAGRRIGFASHVDADTMTKARAAGIEEVMPRSRFFSQIVTILD